MKIYEQIEDLNSAFLRLKKISNETNMPLDIQEQGKIYFDKVKNHVAKNNNKLWIEFSKTYNKSVLVNKQQKMSIDDFDFEKLMKLHETTDIVFNRKCMELNRNELIFYFNNENIENIHTALKQASNSGRVYLYDLKDFKTQSINRNNKLYRKAFINRFLSNKTKEHKETLLKWFEATLNK